MEEDSPLDAEDQIPIGRATSLTDIVAALGQRGCSDLTSSIDLASCSNFPLAGGGFCDVYRGTVGGETKVAIKSLRVFDHPGKENDKEKLMKRAARELYHWSRLKHPNVMPLMGLAMFRGQLSMVSTWMTNGSLVSYIAANPSANRIDLCINICAGLLYMHENDMVHGDLKGANVMISDDGIAMVADFGNSRLRELTLKFTNTTNSAISLRWTAPEIFNGDSSTDMSKEADVYAYGMTVLETLTGKFPYDEYNEQQVMIMVAVKRKTPERPSVGVSDEVWQLLQQCWMWEQSERPGIAVIGERLLASMSDPSMEAEGFDNLDIGQLQTKLLAGRKNPVLPFHGDHANKSRELHDLGDTYMAQFERLGELSDLEKSISCRKEAALSMPGGRASQPNLLNKLGNSYLIRFDLLGDLTDLEISINRKKEAVSLVPDGHADQPGLLSSLGDSYQRRFQCAGEPSDLNSAIDCFRKAAQSLTGPPFERFNACRRWAKLVHRDSMSFPDHAYHQAMELLPQLAWIGASLDLYPSFVTTASDFATEAAAYAMASNNHGLALEWIEAGRLIFWSRTQIRRSFHQLFTQHPDVATRLRELGRQLEQAGSQTFSLQNDAKKELSSRILLVFNWNTVLSEVRSISGFEDFLYFPRSGRLLQAAKSHPIAVINVHDSRCDALILQPNSNSISHIPLPMLSVNDVATARRTLSSRMRGVKKPKDAALPHNKSLEGLWSSVVQPIIEFLGYTRELPIDELPRLTWCMSGFHSLLPLHAAGSHSSHTFNRVISSYTPNLSAILPRLSINLDPSTCHSILSIGIEKKTNGHNLPGVANELAIIREYACGAHHLQLKDEEATVGLALEAISQFSWVHLACHGSQDTTDPTQSAFHLHDGNLTLEMIAKQSFGSKGLAFLSACQTATEAEGVQLATGMLMAGFPSVIGTLWDIADVDGPEIADVVYGELLKDGKMDFTNAAKALHKAVAQLREKVGVKEFWGWAPFIHLGC